MHKLKSKYIKLRKEERLHNAPYPMVGLTGGIASGKTSFSKELVKLGVPVINADELIKNIYQQDQTLEYIKEILPACIQKNQIDFNKLRIEFFNNPQVKQDIENFLYQRLPIAFLKKCDELDFSDYSFIVYDIPLLFEKQLSDQFDTTTLIYAPRNAQLKRLCLRDQIDEKLANSILDQQLDIETKRALAHITITNIGPICALSEKAHDFLEKICSK